MANFDRVILKEEKGSAFLPSLTKTVADKDGLRVEWTEAGKHLLTHIIFQGPLAKFLLPPGEWSSRHLV